MIFLIRTIVLPLLVALVMLPTTALAESCIVQNTDPNEMYLRNGDVVRHTEEVVRYIAVIDRRDLYNSSGTRLTDYRAILQQDRANLHNSGIADRFDDFVEDFDDYFTTLDRRKLLSTAQYYFDCWMSPETITSLQNDIVSGEVAGLVWVIVFRQAHGGLAITISLVG